MMARKRCSVAWVGPSGELLIEVETAAPATIAEVLAAARSQCRDESVPWEGAPVGIHGEVCGRGVVPRDGDRIELYRALRIDPKEARRSRARPRASG
jgi:putative ubiquitin-RnfH superfamily antitoxin RatB of RatAB toxin-antitoxin module